MADDESIDMDGWADPAGIEGDECIMKTGLAEIADHFGFTGMPTSISSTGTSPP